ncbi:MAG: CNNM domain-containing protein [Porticoccaceae bacterium]|nr:CNNM domain-containing protein [Porticoccaceae bacterium]
MFLLALYIGMALGVSFVCSLLEATLLSLTPTYLATLQTQRPKLGILWRNFKADIDKPLAAILSLNTIAHTVGAAGAGAQATKLFGELYFGIISAVLTLLILIFSEIIPKTLGARYWKQLAPVCGYILRWVQWAMHPFVVVSKKLTGWLAPVKDDPSVSRDDFHMLAKMGHQEGVINADEAQAMSALLAFRGLVAKDVMTPRTVMASLPADIQVGDVSPTDPSLKFSRIPIFQDHSEDFIGFVRKDDMFKEAAEGRRDTTLEALRRDFVSVLEGKPLPDLMQTMVDERVSISLVVSEYGDPLGIATMEDLVETMLGMEIVDESDSHIDMQERARQLWRLRANAAGIKFENKD